MSVEVYVSFDNLSPIIPGPYGGLGTAARGRSFRIVRFGDPGEIALHDKGPNEDTVSEVADDGSEDRGGTDGVGATGNGKDRDTGGASSSGGSKQGVTGGSHSLGGAPSLGGRAEVGGAPGQGGTAGFGGEMATDPGPPEGCTVLLSGAADPGAESWTVHDFATGEVVSSDGSSLLIDTTAGSGSPWYLLSFPSAVTIPFHLYFEIQVLSADAHNTADAGLALMGSYTANTHGIGQERSQMIYFEETGVGWADDSGSYSIDTTDKFHRYMLSVDGDGDAQLTIDGALALSYTSFTTNGRISIGDQTNDSGVDGAFRIKNLAICP